MATMSSEIIAETNVDEPAIAGIEGQPSVLISTPGGGSVQLPPIDGSSGVSSKRRPLPPIDTTLMTPGRHGQGDVASTDTIISVGERDSAVPVQTHQSVISVPGHTSESSHGGKELHSAIETIIYLMDKTGIHFTVENGQNAEAGELFEYVMEELRLPAEAREVFSLWLISDLLELQLKPNHIPFKLACYWDELLEKYTTAAEEDIERDEPILMFQRNVFYSRAKEKKLTNPDILRLLYAEAKENVIDSRYPLKQDDCDYLAGLQAHIEQKGFYGNKHTPAFYKGKTNQYYPARFARRKKFSLSSEEQPEDRLCAWHRAASKKLDRHNLSEAYKMYLEFCWKLPYYGAAFFRGQIEHPGQALLTSVKDDPVYVAINPCGVFIIDLDDSIFLLGLLYEDMSWEYAEPCNKENKNCMPCIFLQFQQVEHGECVSKILQVFSREAKLMDALIDTCVEMKKAKHCGCDEVDALDDDGDGVLKADKDSWREFSRLSLATVKGGKCISSTLKRPSKKRKAKK